MRVIELLAAILLIFALYHWLDTGEDIGGDTRIRTTQQIYERSLKKLGWVGETLEEQYKEYKENEE